MRALPMLFAAGLVFGPTSGCSKKSTTSKTNETKEHVTQRPSKPENACKPFCQRLDQCASEIATALVSDLPEGPRKLFKGKLMARYKNPTRCVSDCQRAEKANPGPGSAMARCKDSRDCKALAECLHTMAMERRKKITSAQKDHELKVKGARKASRLPSRQQSEKATRKKTTEAPSENKPAAR